MDSTVRTDCDNYTGLFHPYSWKTPVAAATVYSAPDDGRKGRPKHVEFWQQIKSKKAAFRWYLLAAATVCSAPDDGRKGRPKHVEFWHQKRAKKNCISLVFIGCFYSL